MACVRGEGTGPDRRGVPASAAAVVGRGATWLPAASGSSGAVEVAVGWGRRVSPQGHQDGLVVGCRCSRMKKKERGERGEDACGGVRFARDMVPSEAAELG